MPASHRTSYPNLDSIKSCEVLTRRIRICVTDTFSVKRIDFHSHKEIKTAVQRQLRLIPESEHQAQSIKLNDQAGLFIQSEGSYLSET